MNISQLESKVSEMHDECEQLRREYNLKHYGEKKPALQLQREHEKAARKYQLALSVLVWMRKPTPENKAAMIFEKRSYEAFMDEQPKPFEATKTIPVTRHDRPELYKPEIRVQRIA